MSNGKDQPDTEALWSSSVFVIPCMQKKTVEVVTTVAPCCFQINRISAAHSHGMTVKAVRPYEGAYTKHESPFTWRGGVDSELDSDQFGGISN